MLLKNKNAVIYGGSGAVGSAVARAFALAGAKVFLTGRTLEKLHAVSKEILNAGDGLIEIARVDALNKEAVETHLDEVVQKAGSIDISFNAIGLNDIQGYPLIGMENEQFTSPILNAVNTHFITATAAARHMSKNRSGVILAITANAARRPYINVGGFGVACAAIEGFCRQLAVEVGTYGIRVVCLRSAGSSDAPGVDEVFRQHAEAAGISREAFEADFAQKTMLKRLPRLYEIADTAALMASDKASAVTAAVINLTCGELAD